MRSGVSSSSRAHAIRACSGSVLRGRDTESSDLDILVDPLPGATLFDLGGLQIALQELLGVPVDLLTPGGLPHRARERVLREAVPV